jgi:hypothetical protein
LFFLLSRFFFRQFFNWNTKKHFLLKTFFDYIKQYNLIIKIFLVNLACNQVYFVQLLIFQKNHEYQENHYKCLKHILNVQHFCYYFNGYNIFNFWFIWFIYFQQTNITTNNLNFFFTCNWFWPVFKEYIFFIKLFYFNYFRNCKINKINFFFFFFQKT